MIKLLSFISSVLPPCLAGSNTVEVLEEANVGLAGMG